MKFHHGNARLHATKIVKFHLNDAIFTLFRHSSFSANIVRSDYRLFGRIKLRLDNQNGFKSQKRQINKILQDILKEEDIKVCDKWNELININNKEGTFNKIV